MTSETLSKLFIFIGKKNVYCIELTVASFGPLSRRHEVSHLDPSGFATPFVVAAPSALKKYDPAFGAVRFAQVEARL